MAKGRAKPLGIFKRLVKDHRELRELFADLEEVEDNDGRMNGLEELRRQVIAHGLAEDEVVYGDLEDESDELRELVLEAREVHDLMHHVLRELCVLEPDAETWKAKLRLLGGLFEQHVDAEEREHFELAADLIDEARAEAMVEAFERAKTRELLALARTTPSMTYTEESPPANGRTSWLE